MQATLRGLWREVQEDMHRINARLPKHAPALQGNPPQALLASSSSSGKAKGGGGSSVDMLEVRIPIRDGADIDAVAAEAKAAFETLGSAVSHMKVRLLGSWGGFRA